MIFKGIDNQTVKFRITNYEFPDINDGEWDANWLLIYINVESKVGNWQKVDQSMTTWEFQELIDWFADLSENRKVEEHLRFTEPNLLFELKDRKENKTTIRVSFDLESRPKPADDNKEYFVDCELTNIKLKEIRDDLAKELKKFPVRTYKEIE